MRHLCTEGGYWAKWWRPGSRSCNSHQPDLWTFRVREQFLCAVKMLKYRKSCVLSLGFFLQDASVFSKCPTNSAKLCHNPSLSVLLKSTASRQTADIRTTPGRMCQKPPSSLSEMMRERYSMNELKSGKQGCCGFYWQGVNAPRGAISWCNVPL